MVRSQIAQGVSRFAIGLALMVAIVPGWAGLATTPRWDVGVVIAFALFCSGTAHGHADRQSVSLAQAGLFRRIAGGVCRRIGARGGEAAGVGLALCLIASLAWSTDPLAGIDQAAKLIVVVVGFAWGATLTDLRPLVAGAAAGLAISSLVALAQWFGWTGIETSSTGTPAGLFFNHNRAAEAAALVLAAAVSLRVWWALPGLVPSLILPQERTAWLAVAVVLAIVVWRRLRGQDRFALAGIAAMLLLLAAMTAGLWRTEAFGLAGITERVAMWSFVADRFTVIGHGLGSFTHDGPLLASPSLVGSSVVSITKAEHPHNEFLWLAYEGGLSALGIFGVFAWVVWRSAADLRLVFVAFAVVACFAMPLHDPAAAIFIALCAGFAVGCRDRVRASADAGGDALLAWVDEERESRDELGGVAAGGGSLPVRAAVS